ncbi:DUF2478 domain-containing protein [Falsiroseomonas sp. E2-1-a20]|uniref:DUF2478 domain-containing protein n=1 Tax=Falsiroseomonas sp. E2-1-a20 TaxID=3239300 RepID=UPI003F378B43
MDLYTASRAARRSGCLPSCYLSLEEIMNGIAILQDRDPPGRGCRIDVAELLPATRLVLTTPDQRTDLLVLNEFGKTEADFIAHNIEASGPAAVAELYCNLEQWSVFASNLLRELTLEGFDEAALASLMAAGQAVPACKATDSSAKEQLA